MIVSPLGSSSLIANQISCGPANPVFTIDLLSPNSVSERMEMTAFIQYEFPNACIGVDENLITNWNSFNSRIQGYGGDPIPTFDNDGYDVAFMGYSNPNAPVVKLDGLYVSQSTMNGAFNIMDYSNATFDALHEQYLQTPSAAEREPLAHQMQQILYEDQPSLTILYNQNVWLYKQALAASMNDDVFDGLSIVSISDAWKDIGAGSGISDMVYAHYYDIAELVPQVTSSYIANQYQSAIWQGLYGRNITTNVYEPLLAKSLPVWDETNTIATVDIRTDVSFADGHQMDMTDVIESFKRILTQDAGDISYARLKYYFGNPVTRGWDNIIKQIDADTVQFSLKQPYFQAHELLSYPTLPTHIWGTHDNPTVANYDFNTALQNQADPGSLTGYGFGTGPFRYNQIDSTSGLVELQSNANYWNGTPALDFISFKKYTKSTALSAFDSGVVHFIDLSTGVNSADIAGLSSTDYDHKFSNNYSWEEIAINMHHPIIGTGAQTPLGLEDPSRAQEAARYVRQAMSHAIPRQAIIDDIYDGFGSPGITAWVSDTENFNGQLAPYEYNIQRAKQLLEKAGYDVGIDPSDDPTDNPTEGNNTTTPGFALGPSFVGTFGLMVTPMIMIHFTRRKQSRQEVIS